MESDCRAEIEDLHRFFQEWFAGSLPVEGDSFSRLATVLAPEFGMISPQGVLMDRRIVLQSLRAAHGTSRAPGKPTRIWVTKIRVHNLGEGLALATYEEWQRIDGQDKGRLSSALFRERAETPHGVEWVHLHEVWLPAETQPAPQS
ncbi:MAG: hypothetical protein ACE5ID_02220 [Acidobacteriota bacterium]